MEIFKNNTYWERGSRQFVGGKRIEYKSKKREIIQQEEEKEEEYVCVWDREKGMFWTCAI